MDMRKLVGRNVRRIRLEKGLTQEAFAERSGFTQQYLSGLERGSRNPTIVSLYEIAQALGVEHVALVAPDDVAQSDKARQRGQEVNGTKPVQAARRETTSDNSPARQRPKPPRKRR